MRKLLSLSLYTVILPVVLIYGCDEKEEVTVQQEVKQIASAKVVNMFFEEGYMHVETSEDAFVFDYYKDAVFPRGEEYEVLYIDNKRILNVPTSEYDKFITLFEEQRLYVAK